METSLLTMVAILTLIDGGLVTCLAVTRYVRATTGTIAQPGQNSNSSNTMVSPTAAATIPPPEVPVRLANGSSECSGRVELFHQGGWRPLCREFWESKGADVVCGQLGCGSARTLSRAGGAGGPAPFWVVLMNCTGAEADWRDCPKKVLAAGTTCDRNLSADVTCTEHKEMRLVGGGSRCAGRVEIHSNGTWGTVCDDSWDLHDAAVVCRQLGCGFAISAAHASRFGQGRGHIYLDQVNCSGTEAYLWSCPSAPWLRHDCGHKEDAGVECSGHREIRLTGGQDPCQGRVSVRDQGTWGSLCDTVWDLTLAHGICRYLGCGNASRLDQSYKLTSGHTWGDMCQDNASEIPACLHSLPRNACDIDRAAGVVCTGSLNLTGRPPNVTTDWMTTVGAKGPPPHSDDFLLLIIGLLVFLLVIVCVLFVVNDFKMKRRMVMHLAHPVHNDSIVSTNEYREVSATPATNHVKPPSRNVGLAAVRINEDSDSFEDDYEDYDTFAPNPALNFSTFKSSVRNQSQRRNPPSNAPETFPEAQRDGNNTGRRSDARHRSPEDNVSSSGEEDAATTSAWGGRGTAKPGSQRWRRHPLYKKSVESSSTSSCEWYENTKQFGQQPQIETQLLAVPLLNELQSSASTLPVEEYENVEGGNQKDTQPAIPVTAAPTVCTAANQQVDESSESDYDDIGAYTPS